MAKILMITATSDNNRALADKFADSAREMGHEADIIDLVELDMPMFTVARSKELDTVPGMAESKGSNVRCRFLDDNRSRVQWFNASYIEQRSCVAKYRMARFPCSIQPTQSWTSNSQWWRRCSCNHGYETDVLFLGCIVLGRNCISNKNKEANPETIEDMLNQLAN